MPRPLDSCTPSKRSVRPFILPIALVWAPLLSALVYHWITQRPLAGTVPVLALSSLIASGLTALTLRGYETRAPQTAPVPPDTAAETPAHAPEPQAAVSPELLTALEEQFQNGGSQVQLSDILQQLEDSLPQLTPNDQRLLCLQTLQTYLRCTPKAEDAAIGENTAASQQLFRMVRHTITNLSSPSPDPEASTGTEMQAILLDYVDQNCLDSSLCLNSAADYLNTSIYAVSRIFKDATGVGFKEYITGKRLQYACQLLETTRKTVSAVAAESGFENSTYFTTVFKNEYGIPPSKFRAKAQQHTENQEV